MNENLNKLNSVLSSSSVKNTFFEKYNNDYEFKNWLLNILPEVEACRLQKQNTVWHIYNVLEHILVSVQNINKLTVNLNNKEKLMLSYVMFLHDIGKPECHSIRLDKNKIERDSFFNHQIASEKIASRVLPNFGFNKHEINIITRLVLEHDFFIYLGKQKNLTSNKLLSSAEEKIKDFNNYKDPYKMNGMLIMVGLADNLAQNPTLTKPIVALIKQYETVSTGVKSNFIHKK